MKARSLQELKALKKQLASRREKQTKAGSERGRAEHQLFMQAMRGVTPLQHSPRRPPGPHPAPALPLQRWADEAQALHEAMSDEFDVSTLLDTDGRLSFHRPGIGPDVPLKLRKGHWSIQAELDLHGLRRDEAREVLGQFLHQSRKQGLRCVRIVHGKGLGSPGRSPILRPRVYSWLVQKKAVLAFAQAKPLHGGSGAVVVLLARSESQNRNAQPGALIE